MLTSRGLGRVLGDLASMGFDARWGVLGAADVGANHQRDRIWIVARNMAYANLSQCKRGSMSSRIQQENSNIGSYCGNAKIPNTTSQRQQGSRQSIQWSSSAKEGKGKANIFEPIGIGNQWSVEPSVGRVADGVAARVDRLKAIGNGQVPLCAATAWRILSALY